MDYQKVGTRIRTERKKLNLTQEKVAEKVGITASFYSHIENGTRKASITTFVSIADCFDISLDYIIMGKGFHKATTDEYTKQINHRIRYLSDKEKIFILNFIESLNQHKE